MTSPTLWSFVVTFDEKNRSLKGNMSPVKKCQLLKVVCSYRVLVGSTQMVTGANIP
jgi:hypothetical protein